jgi:hypothetical protein
VILDLPTLRTMLFMFGIAWDLSVCRVRDPQRWDMLLAL